jgi:hypothetical protein
VTDEQLDKLKTKRHHLDLREELREEERWRDMYAIIFPDVPADRIPSPCKHIRSKQVFSTAS